jgi:hypothetical protein
MGIHMLFSQMLSYDNPKASKAIGFGYLNGISYLAPHKLSGGPNLCSHAKQDCISLCLGQYSGQAAMAKAGEISTVLDSRIRKARYFISDRQGFLNDLSKQIASFIKLAESESLIPVVRLNGSTDSPYEKLSINLTEKSAAYISAKLGEHCKSGHYDNLMSLFPSLQFNDYTKNPSRFKKQLPKNYDITFSRSAYNESDCRNLLALGHNVAAVFAQGLPDSYMGRPVINGDSHDLRFLDPKGGFIVGLTPKGAKAKKDMSGFVIRDYERFNA